MWLRIYNLHLDPQVVGLDHTSFLYLLLKSQQRQRRKKVLIFFYGNCTLRAAVPAGLTLLSAEQCNTHWKKIVSVYEWIFSLHFILFLPHFISKTRDNANMTLHEKSVRMVSLYSTKKVYSIHMLQSTTNLVRTYSLPQTNTLLVQLNQIMFGGAFIYWFSCLWRVR